MSYPSINTHLERQGVTLEHATDAQLEQAFLAAFREDLPLGMSHVDALAEKAKGNDSRAMVTLHPNSDEGKQFARLLGADIARQVLEKHHGVAFGFYNCCKGVASRTREGLALTMREQIEAQHPNFVDC